MLADDLRNIIERGNELVECDAMTRREWEHMLFALKDIEERLRLLERMGIARADVVDRTNLVFLSDFHGLKTKPLKDTQNGA